MKKLLFLTMAVLFAVFAVHAQLVEVSPDAGAAVQTVNAAADGTTPITAGRVLIMLLVLALGLIAGIPSMCLLAYMVLYICGYNKLREMVNTRAEAEVLGKDKWKFGRRHAVAAVVGAVIGLTRFAPMPSGPVISLLSLAALVYSVMWFVRRYREARDAMGVKAAKWYIFTEVCTLYTVAFISFLVLVVAICVVVFSALAESSKPAVNDMLGGGMDYCGNCRLRGSAECPRGSAGDFDEPCGKYRRS